MVPYPRPVTSQNACQVSGLTSSRTFSEALIQMDKLHPPALFVLPTIYRWFEPKESRSLD